MLKRTNGIKNRRQKNYQNLKREKGRTGPEGMQFLGGPTECATLLEPLKEATAAESNADVDSALPTGTRKCRFGERLFAELIAEAVGFKLERIVSCRVKYGASQSWSRRPNISAWGTNDKQTQHTSTHSLRFFRRGRRFAFPAVVENPREEDIFMVAELAAGGVNPLRRALGKKPYNECC